MPTVNKVYKYGIYLTKEEITKFNHFDSLCRELYNELVVKFNTLLQNKDTFLREQCPEYFRIVDEIAYVDVWRNSNFTKEQRKNILDRLKLLKKAEEESSKDQIKAAYNAAYTSLSTARKLLQKELFGKYNDSICWTMRTFTIKAFEEAAQGKKLNAGKFLPVGYRLKIRKEEKKSTIGGQSFIQEGCIGKNIFNFKNSKQEVLVINNGVTLSSFTDRSERRRACRVPFKFRLSNSTTINGTISYHRHIPVDSIVKNIFLGKHIEGGNVKYYLLLHISMEEKPTGQDVAGFDMGWAMEEGSLIAGAIATASDSKILAPPSLEKRDWADRLQSATSKEMDTLREFLKENLSKDEYPTIAFWKNPNRFASLMNDPGLTDKCYEAVNAWKYHRNHRLAAIDGATNDAIITRNQYYYGIVKELRNKGIGYLAIESSVLRSFSKRDKDSKGVSTQRQRARVGISVFLNFVKNSGIQLVEIDPKYTSQTCTICGAVDKESRSGRSFKCSHCGNEDHADINAAKNIRMKGCEWISGDKTPDPARAVKKPSRFERLQTGKAKKKKQEEATS